MFSVRRTGAALGALAFAALAAAPAFAADAAPVVNKGDTAWMLTSSLLVLMMIVPGLALFYGGLARTKNMLSVMTQVGAVAALAMLVWVGWGYSEAFGDGGGAYISGFGKAFLKGVTPASTAATFTAGVAIPEYVFVCFQMTFAAITMLVWVGWGYSEAFGDEGNAFIGGFGKALLKGVTPASHSATLSAGVAIPEYVFVCFQMTFAAITLALVLGAVVERIKFSAVLVFGLVWLTLVYFPDRKSVV